MGKTYRGFGSYSNHRHSSRGRFRGSFRESQRSDRITRYCSLDLRTGDVRSFDTMHDACGYAFGSNKKTKSQNWLAIYRDENCFICL